MGKKIKKKIHLNGKTSEFEVNRFPATGHQSYSGFGAHIDKYKTSEKRNRRLEEQRARFYGE